MVYQKEKAPTTGTEHFQGYVCFSKKVTLFGAKKHLPSAHWEPRQGTHDQAVAYCTKADTRVGAPVILGEAPCPGKRTDLESVAGEVLAGKPLKRVAEDSPALFAKHFKGLQALRLATVQPRSGVKPEVIIFTGPSGIGKSRHIQSKWPDCYRKDSSSKWWDGYDGQETVFFDEFYGGISYNDMLQIVDWYPKQVETKGGHVQLQAHRFIFSSNKPWQEWYSGVEDRSAFKRRVEEFGVVHQCLTSEDVINEIVSTPPPSEPFAPHFLYRSPLGPPGIGGFKS